MDLLTQADQSWHPRATACVSCLMLHLILSFIVGSFPRLELSYHVFEDHFRHTP